MCVCVCVCVRERERERERECVTNTQDAKVFPTSHDPVCVCVNVCVRVNVCVCMCMCVCVCACVRNKHAGCKSVSYCSRSCQKNSWPQHKQICGAHADDRAEYNEDKKNCAKPKRSAET